MKETTKKLIPVISAVLLAPQLVGCSATSKMVKMIDNGDSIAIALVHTNSTSQPVSREKFYALVSTEYEGMQVLAEDESYFDTINSETDYSHVQEHAFLNTREGGLDHNTVTGSISRAEAVYMLVDKYFYDEARAVDSKATAYSDCKNGGDVALKAGFKTKEKGSIIAKDNWQSYTLAYMIQNPNKGMQEELYRAMVVAYELNLLGNAEDSRWDEPLSKTEAIQLLTNVYQALNDRDGYLTNKEYGQIVENKNGDSGRLTDEGDYSIDMTEDELAISKETPPSAQGNKGGNTGGNTGSTGGNTVGSNGNTGGKPALPPGSPAFNRGDSVPTNKTPALSTEEINDRIIDKGQDPNQGVG